MIKASLKNFRQSPRKVRKVANLVRGKSVNNALDTLNFLNKKASDPIYELLQSAISNAKNNHNLSKESLIIKELRVDGGVIMKRRMPSTANPTAEWKKESGWIVSCTDKRKKAM